MIRRFSTSLITMVALVPMASVVGSAQTHTPLTRHVRDVVSNGQARLVGRLPATQSMRITFVLPLQNQSALDSLLQDLYNPSSPTFHQWLTVEEFTSRFGPSQENYDAVVSYAETKGFTVVGTSRNRLNVDVTGSVAAIEAALHVTMGVYQHPTEDRTFFSPDCEPTPDLTFPLWRVAGLDSYSIPKPALTRNPGYLQNPAGASPNATTGSCPSASFCGSDMRAAYYEATALTGTGQSLGLFEFGGTDLADLNTYYKNAHQTNNVPITLLSVDGTPASCTFPTCDDTEQTIDMTQALGMAPGLASLVMYVGASSPSLDDAGILNAMATASPLNGTLSCSWLWRPPDPTVDDPYFQEFATQGQNFFVAAGDSGHWTGSASQFVWPADDPYITSVGGTDLTTASAAGPWASETAWVDGGGGISPNKFPIPSWQVAAAATCSKCSTVYRNGPDVSANANFTFYVCADQEACTANNYGGTSFATPMWAAYIALANQQEVTNTGSRLGFINPALYTIYAGPNYTTDFHDITSGSNGYSATVGYDLATGLGSPNGPNLINALTAGSTPPSFTLSASPTGVLLSRGTSGTTTITATISGTFNAPITLSASGQGAGEVIKFSPATIPAPGSGTSVMTIGATKSAKLGKFTVTITGTGGGLTETTTITVGVK